MLEGELRLYADSHDSCDELEDVTGQESKPNFADYTPRICQSFAARASYAKAAGQLHWRPATELSKSSQTEPMTSFMADPDQLL